MHQRLISDKIYENLCEVIPGGVNSPVRAFKGLNIKPVVIASGNGAIITDEDGREYIDYCGSWGALIHGHANKKILKKVKERINLGTSFGITTKIEGEIAHKVKEIIPHIEKIRFVSSGTEATMSAVRLARGYTKKQYIIKFNGHYHGHADYFLVQAGSGVSQVNPTSSSAGIPDEMLKYTLSLPFNNEEALSRVFEDPTLQSNIAAVILEPVAGNMGVVPATKNFLKKIRDFCNQYHSVMIIDEVMTGFRIAYRGAYDYYDIQADLTTFGKIIGGGFPAAAFGGKAEIMNYLAPLGPVYQAGTLSGNPVAMEAGFQALKLLQAPNFYKKLEQKTNFLTNMINQAISDTKANACLQQAGSMFTIFFGRKSVTNYEEAKLCDLNLFAEFFRYMLSNGVYIPPLQMEAWFVSTAHTKDYLIKTGELVAQFLKKYN
ncbi:MAG: glutamate-1-semialdehyde-2,1-aminomutase [Chlamydia sp. 32-24]|nr:MAG: glutamate-1-semialdehyde-2,1-aminomutase [Chlamydia sp. 32-24]